MIVSIKKKGEKEFKGTWLLSLKHTLKYLALCDTLLIFNCCKSVDSQIQVYHVLSFLYSYMYFSEYLAFFFH